VVTQAGRADPAEPCADRRRDPRQQFGGGRRRVVLQHDVPPQAGTGAGQALTGPGRKGRRPEPEHASVAGDGAANRSSIRLSDSVSIQAIGVPTGTLCPSPTSIPTTVPSAGASTSMSTLSVRISQTTCPSVTRSPTAIRHPTSSPSSVSRGARGETSITGPGGAAERSLLIVLRSHLCANYRHFLP
jgi:hypothetical protein